MALALARLRPALLAILVAATSSGVAGAGVAGAEVAGSEVAEVAGTAVAEVAGTAVTEVAGTSAGTSAVGGATELRLATDPAGIVTVEATGIPRATLAELSRRRLDAEDWLAIFPVYTGALLPPATDRPPVAGTWDIAGDVLRFRPRFPLVPGLPYVARLDLTDLRPAVAAPPPAIHATLQLPAEIREPSTVVDQIYPTAAVLPENLLRLYLHFSAPMSRGEAYRHIRLLDAAGQAAERPFLEVGEELWDPAQRRMTLFFDPGRIKRGLRPHFEAGPPLREGETYTLAIARDWHDAHGQPMARGFEKTFTVAAPARRALDITDWTLTPPVAESVEPLKLRFPTPLDHGLLQRVIRVLDARGEAIAGEVAVGEDEMSFTFRPASPWRQEAHAVAIETILEDVAGNNFKQTFDLEAKTETTPTDQAVIQLSFSPAAR